MPTLYQDDLFGGPSRGTTVPDDPRPRRRRRIADTTRAAGERHGPTQRERDQDVCLEEIRKGGLSGRTRNEVEANTHLNIRNICWAVDALLKRQLVFRPVVGRKPNGGPAYLARAGCQVLIDDQYRSHFEPRPRSISAELDRSA